MKINITHSKTNKSVDVESDNNNLTFTGDDNLIKGLKEYFNSFYHTIGSVGRKEHARNKYGEELIKREPGTVSSIDTANSVFLKKFFIKDMEDMGCKVTILEDDD